MGFRHQSGGLRVCQNDNCRLHQNRDKGAALNIATQFTRLFKGDGPLVQMTKDEIELTSHRCIECSTS